MIDLATLLTFMIALLVIPIIYARIFLSSSSLTILPVINQKMFMILYNLFCFISYLLFSDDFIIGAIIILISFGLPLFIIDSLYYILPDKLVGSLFLAFIYHCLMQSPYPMHFHIFSSLILFILLILLSSFYSDSFGGGDIKLLSSIAFLTGVQKSLELLLLSSILGILFYLVVIKDQNTPLPFGPFILISSLIILLI